MTKPLAPEEKARRAAERSTSNGSDMVARREELLAKERARIAEEDAKIAKEHEAKVEADRKHLAEEKERTRLADAARAAEQAEKERLRAEAAQVNAGTQTSATVSAPRADSKIAKVLPGYIRCEGSTLNVEDNSIPLLNGRTLRDDDPWDYRGKRVLCPNCGHKVGVSPFGRRSAPQPEGYRLDTHYRKPSG